jgi:hypothetical protein
MIGLYDVLNSHLRDALKRYGFTAELVDEGSERVEAFLWRRPVPLATAHDFRHTD